MKEAIQKAIEGGNYVPKFDYKILGENRHPLLEEAVASAFLLDPLFWQCLGKALGWSGKVDMKFINAFGNTLVIEQIERWEMHQHKFIHHLAEGKDVDSFFKELLK